MRARIALVVGLLAACGVGIGVARAAGTRTEAAGTHTLCSAGAGKPVVSAKSSGKCGKGKKAVVLAKSSSLTSLQSQVTALQSQDQTLAGRVTTLEGKVATLEASTVPAQVTTLNGEVSSLQSDVATLKASTVPAQVTTLNGEVGALESLLAGITRANDTLTFSGMNLQLVSGSGSTDGTVNGLGNLIIGYNENPGTQTGSHNLVLGEGQAFTSYGGIVGGENNTIGAPFANVLGGENNSATGQKTSILGGNGFSAGATDATAGAGLVASVTGAVGFTLAAGACGGFNVSDGALALADVPLFAYTTTPPTGAVVFTPGAVTTAGQAKFTACNISASSVTFSGSLHLVAFRT